MKVYTVLVTVVRANALYKLLNTDTAPSSVYTTKLTQHGIEIRTSDPKAAVDWVATITEPLCWLADYRITA